VSDAGPSVSGVPRTSTSFVVAIAGICKQLVSERAHSSATAMASLCSLLPAALAPPPAFSTSQLNSRRRFNALSLELRLFRRVPSFSSTRRRVSESRVTIRAVSVSGDTEQKESDVKKRTSYRPVVILPVRVVL
jgi:hypothetical protein